MSALSVTASLWILTLFQGQALGVFSKSADGFLTPVNINQDVEDGSITAGHPNISIYDDEPWINDLLDNLETSGDNSEGIKKKRSIYIPEYMFQMYDNSTSDRNVRDEEFCRDETHVSFPNEGTKSFDGCGTREIRFDLGSRKESFSDDMIFRSAELHVELFPEDESGDRDLGEVPRAGGRHSPKPFSVQVTVDFQFGKTTETLKQVVNVGDTDEAVFDVTSFVGHWLSEIKINGNRQLVINITLELPNGNLGMHNKFCRYAQWAPSLLVSWENYTSCSSIRRPTYSKPDPIEVEDSTSFDGASVRSRQRRSLPSKSLKERTGCRRIPLEVNFHDIGWDSWIIAPSGYNAYTCVGSCTYPLPAHGTPTSHAVVTTLTKEILGTGKGACCVPTAFEPLQILYYDKRNKVVLKMFKEMVATECGCR
ncbi:bone morphogenetic protein 2-like [Palaemon carinicauda]|uniref:bone morphogenetic protein 2-like n=1 Tax=Palaemon carinicauda TaxID=392227 RepID=UPI0035B63E71